MNAGIHPTLSNADYHATTGWVGSSQLKACLPEFYKPFNGSSAADFGSVFHQRFTGEDVPVVTVDAATWTGKAAQEQQSAIIASGGLPILSRDLDTLNGMEAAVRAHCEAASLLTGPGGSWELSVFAEVDGVPSKARFDRITESGVGVDIKTFSAKPSRYEIARAVMTWGYELQQTHYMEVAQSAGIELAGFKFVFVSKEPPHYVLVVELDEQWLERGAVLRDIALSRFLHPQFSDPYEGAEGTLILGMPNFGRL